MRCTSKKACQRRASKTLVGATLLLVVAAGHLPARVDAQSAAAPAQIPDLSETWARLGPLPGRPNAPLVPTARAIGFGLAFDEVLSPRYDCSPVSAPLILLDPFNFQIEQQADRVILRYEKDDVVRTVWLEGHGHPEPGAYDYTIQGHSIGRYENNQLVVVTSKFVFEPTGLDEPRHIPSSTLKKVTERYWREGDRLTRIFFIAHRPGSEAVTQPALTCSGLEIRASRAFRRHRFSLVSSRCQAGVLALAARQPAGTGSAQIL